MVKQIIDPFNLQEVYDYLDIELEMSKFYNKIAKKIDKDKNFALADDEVSELIVDLIQKYINN